MDNVIEKIYNCTLKLLASTDTKELYKSIVVEGKELVNAEFGSIYLDNNDTFSLAYSSLPFLNKFKLRRNGFVQKTFQTRKIVILHEKDILKIRPALGRKAMQSVIMIPLSYVNKSIGVLCFNSSKQEHFSDNELHILKLFGSIASLAITKAHHLDSAKNAIEIRDRFISLASHELRTPLTSINGYIQLLYAKLANKGTSESRWVEELYKENIRLTTLIKELLDVNRIKQGQLHFVLKEVNILELLEKAIKLIHANYSERDVQFKNLVKQKNTVLVIGDYEKLLDILNALLNNAVKFSPPHSKIVVAIELKDRTIFIHIKDKGKGIPKKDIPKIFEGFYKHNIEQYKEGMGVGLLLAKHIIEYHKGKLSIISEENKGTTITIELPSIQYTH